MTPQQEQPPRTNGLRQEPDWTYIDHLQRVNADALSFYPIEALQRQGTVREAVENGTPCGYLWHGPLRPQADAVIYQAAIDYDLRRRHHGLSLVRALVEDASAAGALAVRLRSASNLDADEFWQAAGFTCIGILLGGKRRRRDLNLYRYELQPSLGLLLPIPPSDRQEDRREWDRQRAAMTKVQP